MSSDEELLLQRVKDGDAEAFQALFEKHYPTLFRTLHYKFGDEELARDIAQETFFKVWRNRNRLKPKLAFLAYVMKLGRNLALDHFKYEDVRVKHRESVRFLTEKPGSSPDRDLQQQMLERRIRTAVVEDLPEKRRLVFLLSRMEGLSNQEIANRLQISKKTVENQLYQALKTIRKKCVNYL